MAIISVTLVIRFKMIEQMKPVLKWKLLSAYSTLCQVPGSLKNKANVLIPNCGLCGFYVTFCHSCCQSGATSQAIDDTEIPTSFTTFDRQSCTWGRQLRQFHRLSP